MADLDRRIRNASRLNCIDPVFKMRASDIAFTFPTSLRLRIDRRCEPRRFRAIVVPAHVELASLAVEDDFPDARIKTHHGAIRVTHRDRTKSHAIRLFVAQGSEWWRLVVPAVIDLDSG